jgi:hypothetical protein
LLSDETQRQEAERHEAEIDDFLDIVDVVDLHNAFVNGRCVASNLDNLPKYGPEEMNLASIVERQLRTETTVKDMATAIEHISTNHSAVTCTPDIEATSHLVGELQQKLELFSSSVCARIDHLSTVCSTACSRPTTTSPSGTHQPPPPDVIGRRTNLIIFGVKEDRDNSVWHKAVDDIMNFVTGHHIEKVSISLD